MSSKTTKARWKDLYPGFPTEETIRLLHGAPGCARVSLYKYAPGADSNGTSKPLKFYVLAGSCTFRAPEDILDFAGGNFSLKADSDLGVRLVLAWDFPEQFRRPHPGRH
jgi:hypothetical protein